MTAVPEDLVFRYMCGRLSEEERTEMETRCLGDEEAFEDVQALEEEWIDRYARDDLSPTARASFEEGFLISPERRQRVEFARALARARSPRARGAVTPRVRPGTRLPAAWAAVAVVGSGLALLLFTGDRADRPRTRPGVTAPPRPSPPPEAPALSLTLASGALRGRGTAERVVVPPGTVHLELRARLPSEAPHAAAVDAALEVVAHGVVWRQEAVPVRRAAEGVPEVVLRVPVASLATDDYILRLAAHGSPPQELAAYFLALRLP